MQRRGRDSNPQAREGAGFQVRSESLRLLLRSLRFVVLARDFGRQALRSF